MENKKTFGSFICQRRKELGLTQREFAQRLFVTDSAVSKWERGLAYPDITLLQSICQVLQCSEKELLSASEDTEGRRIAQLAQKHLRLTRNYRLTHYLLFSIITGACFIGNLAVGHGLTWFWIVLAGEALTASLTLLPTFLPDRWRGPGTLGGFVAALLILLLVCCLYGGGRWFPVAAVGVLFGFGLVFLPLVLRVLPLPERLAHRKALLYVGAELALLILLYGVCCLSTGGSWFVSAALWTVFGVGLCLLPPLMKQLPLPEPLGRHKALVWLAFQSLLLFLGILWECWRAPCGPADRGGSLPDSALGLAGGAAVPACGPVVPGGRSLCLDRRVGVAGPLGSGPNHDVERRGHQPPLAPDSPGGFHQLD